MDSSDKRSLHHKWTGWEDAVLLDNARSNFGTPDFPKILAVLKHRTLKQAKERWENSLDPSKEKGNWSIAEQIRLLDCLSDRAFFVRECVSWKKVQLRFSNRSCNSIKKKARFLLGEKLSKRCQRLSNIHATSWTPQEDSKLLNLHFELRNDYEEISLGLKTGRSKAQIERRLLEICQCEVCHQTANELIKDGVNLKVSWTIYKAKMVRNKLMDRGTIKREYQQHAMTDDQEAEQADTVATKINRKRQIQGDYKDGNSCSMNTKSPEYLMQIVGKRNPFNLVGDAKKIIGSLDNERSVKLQRSKRRRKSEHIENQKNRKVTSAPLTLLYSSPSDCGVNNEEIAKVHEAIKIVQDASKSGPNLLKEVFEGTITRFLGQDAFISMVKYGLKHGTEILSPALNFLMRSTCISEIILKDPRFTDDFLIPSEAERKFDVSKPIGTIIRSLKTYRVVYSCPLHKELYGYSVQDQFAFKTTYSRLQAYLACLKGIRDYYLKGESWVRSMEYKADGGVLIVKVQYSPMPEGMMLAKYQDETANYNHLVHLPPLFD